MSSLRDREKEKEEKSAPSLKKEIITKSEWEQRIEEVSFAKTDLNKLILNYLVIEGFKDAAEQFCNETGLEPGMDLGSIQDRMVIRNAIENGNIQAAVEHVNDLDPDILDDDPQLYFHLQQQRLIELIRQGNIKAALEFAQEELAPRGEENPAFLVELEKTLALLVFNGTENNPLKELLDLTQRQKTASEMNAAILTSQSQEKDPKLPLLLKNLVWSQNALDEHAIYPKIENFAKGELIYPVECDANSDVPMVL